MKENNVLFLRRFCPGGTRHGHQTSWESCRSHAPPCSVWPGSWTCHKGKKNLNECIWSIIEAMPHYLVHGLVVAVKSATHKHTYYGLVLEAEPATHTQTYYGLVLGQLKLNLPYTNTHTLWPGTWSCTCHTHTHTMAEPATHKYTYYGLVLEQLKLNLPHTNTQYILWPGTWSWTCHTQTMAEPATHKYTYYGLVLEQLKLNLHTHTMAWLLKLNLVTVTHTHCPQWTVPHMDDGEKKRKHKKKLKWMNLKWNQALWRIKRIKCYILRSVD